MYTWIHNMHKSFYYVYSCVIYNNTHTHSHRPCNVQCVFSALSVSLCLGTESATRQMQTETADDLMELNYRGVHME